MEKKELRKRLFLLILLFDLLILLGFCLWFELTRHPFMHWLDNLLYDNYNHYLKCEDLPSINEVNSIIQAHRNILDGIDQLAPGIVGWQVEEPCAGKGNILFWYGSHDQRNQIEEMIGSEIDFFGIPIRMRNQ